MNWIVALPYISIVAFTIGLLVYDLFRASEMSLGWVLTACVFTIFLLLQELVTFTMPHVTAFHGLVQVDSFSALFSIMLLIGTAFTSLLHHRQLAAQRVAPTADIDVLLLFATLGGMVMVSAANLIVFFVGFELLSLSVYVLSGVAKRERASAEGALKYFILGAFSSTFMLYGITLIYGATGSMDLAVIGRHAFADNSMLLVGLGLLLFGFCFKISVVPFHFWAPDVYQGAPVSITAFMAVVVKAAAFGSFLRIMDVAFGSIAPVWEGFLWTISVLTMTVGNLMALRQRSIKRMLAYSSVSHAGYALMGFLALGPAQGAEAVSFYMLTYMFMTLSAFGTVLIVTAGSPAQYAEDDQQSLSGIGWSHPFLGIVMTIAVLSLAGMPPLGGFVGKFYLFSAAIKAGYVGLAIIAALNSVVSLYYYLGVIVTMYFSGERKLSWSLSEELPAMPCCALAMSTFGIIYLGLFSENCIRIVQIAIKSLG